MKPFTRLVATVPLVVAVVAAFTVPAVAAPLARRGNLESAHRGADHAVFVQTDNPAGNAVVAYHRALDGSLTEAGTYATGGNGGVLTGSVVDHLASQGSLTYDADHQLLLAVNAGSNTVTVFSVRGDRLALRQVLRSGGQFPVSVAVHGNVAYVVNARAGGSVEGFRIVRDDLRSIPGSRRNLGLDTTATPEFVNTPGQVAFTPDGSQLIVTTKANGSSIDTFRVEYSGRLSAAPVVNAEPGTVPFGVSFDAERHLVIAEAGTDSVASFDLNADGTIAPLAAAPTGQAATCWIATIKGQFYASNAGSASVSRVQAGPAGALTLLDQTSTDAGTVDAAPSADGQNLYVQTGANGIVDEFHVNADGSLTQIGSVTVANGIGGEGIVAV